MFSLRFAEGIFKASTKFDALKTYSGVFKILLNKHGLNAERGIPSPLCALPMQRYTLPIALSTVCILSSFFSRTLLFRVFLLNLVLIFDRIP